MTAARAAADGGDPGGSFFGFLARVAEESAAKRDLPDAISVPGPLRDALYETLAVLLGRAQQVGAVRPDVTALDVIALVKGAVAAIQDTSAGVQDPGMGGRVFAVLADGLRR